MKFSPDNYHSFYIPVMGTCFTIDTPLAVAKYGISSVIPLTDDILAEQIRKYWCDKTNEPYEIIAATAKDSRARRITAYLNLVNKLVTQQFTKLKNSAFSPQSEISKYFELLPENLLKKYYYKMLATKDAATKIEMQNTLREALNVGSVDVNIMTKLDPPRYENGTKLPYEYSDAASALRGYANSSLASTIVLSAGFNPNLYAYLADFNDFFPDENGFIKKKICLKVSDFRSAAIQGKYLAKHGLWISEYRIESALNCGGHAFINDGQLMGTILEEFKQRKDELIASLHQLYQKALSNMKKFMVSNPLAVKITAQGGVGTHLEHQALLNYYGLNAVGWGTPFLLVPEVTNVDDETLGKLLNATPNDVFISNSSPMGVPFWNLRHSASELAREQRIIDGKPGAICTKGFAKLNTEFTERPICTASREYQKLKLEALDKMNLPPQKFQILKQGILDKSCICKDLAGCALLKRDIDKKATPAICPGPNLINFRHLMSLKEMVNHIYGYCSQFSETIRKDRPHMFIREISLQIDHLLDDIKKTSQGLPARSQQKLLEVKENLLKGIEYYQSIAEQIAKEHHTKFINALNACKIQLEQISFNNEQLSY